VNIRAANGTRLARHPVAGRALLLADADVRQA